MNKFALCFLVFSSISLCGCSKLLSEEVSREFETYTIISVKPPKPMFVELKDKNNQIHHVFVSQSCKNWKDIVINSKVKFKSITYKKDGKLIKTIQASKLCIRN